MLEHEDVFDKIKENQNTIRGDIVKILQNRDNGYYENFDKINGMSLLKFPVINLIILLTDNRTDFKGDSILMMTKMIEAESERLNSFNNLDFDYKFLFELQKENASNDDFFREESSEYKYHSMDYLQYIFEYFLPLLNHFFKIYFSGINLREKMVVINEGYNSKFTILETFLKFTDMLTVFVDRKKEIVKLTYFEPLHIFINFFKDFEISEKPTYLKVKQLTELKINALRFDYNSPVTKYIKLNRSFHGDSNTKIVEIKNISKIEKKWDIFVKEIKDIILKKDKIELEYKSFGKLLSNLKEMDFNQILSRNYINSKFVIMKIIRHILDTFYINSHKPTVIKLTQYLTLMLDIDEEKDDEENGINDKKLEETQNVLNYYGATSMILTIFSDQRFEMDPDLFKVFLNLGINLLNKGNLKVQETIYNYFISYPRSEVLFERFYHLINLQIKLLKNEDTAGDSYNLDISDHKFTENVMKFLQLLAEGHNLNLQKYLKNQTMSIISYDMISLTVEFLKALYLKNDRQYFESLENTLDMLIEFVQGPCLENQLTIIESEFLDLANQILSLRIMDKNGLLYPIKLNRRDNKLTSKMICKLKNRVNFT